MAGAKRIEGTDWNLISIVPYREILASSKNIRNQTLLAMLIMGTFAYLIAFVLSRMMSRRIGLLIRKMKRVKEGSLETIKANLGRDEIGQLVENYNYMIENTKQLLNDQFALGTEIKSAELKALQSQINPHFLYNTLDLINWIAIERNVPEISKLIVIL
ncbi:sensor histidine kinase [Paenibacillus humicola]|uniref:sensor histidine kinase n=1 Tax=Paenibacillus humicola TaxID=3110540 RepID=UPI00237A5B99|nr:histidine kinase [Paenibacillus humicola]